MAASPSSSTFTASPAPTKIPKASKNSGSSTPVGAIVGGIVGGVVLIAVLIGRVVLLAQKKEKFRNGQDKWRCRVTFGESSLKRACGKGFRS